MKITFEDINQLLTLDNVEATDKALKMHDEIEDALTKLKELKIKLNSALVTIYHKTPHSPRERIRSKITNLQ